MLNSPDLSAVRQVQGKNLAFFASFGKAAGIEFAENAQAIRF